jgi:hypothetical protein
MTTEIEKVEVIPAGAIEAMERANIDVQIATAHKYPRSLDRFQKTAMTMVTQDEDTAASCLYSRPVGEGKFAEGMSIRMAEIVASGFGNLRVGSMLIEQTERQVKARGFAHDLESNFAATSEVVESTVDKYGKPYSERMRIVVAKACLAKARRDATFQVVPRALCKSLEDAARKTAIGDAATLEKRRGMVMEWITKLGIDKARVFAALKVQGPVDIGLNELETLTGLRTAIKEGDVSIDEAFPKIMNPTDKQGAAGLADKLKGKKADKEETTAQEIPPMDRAALLKETLALWDKSKASRCEAAYKLAGLVQADNGDYMLNTATVEQLNTIKTELTK